VTGVFLDIVAVVLLGCLDPLGIILIELLLVVRGQDAARVLRLTVAVRILVLS
jgi:hypothetical protein